MFNFPSFGNFGRSFGRGGFGGFGGYGRGGGFGGGGFGGYSGLSNRYNPRLNQNPYFGQFGGFGGGYGGGFGKGFGGGFGNPYSQMGGGGRFTTMPVGGGSDVQRPAVMPNQWGAGNMFTTMPVGGAPLNEKTSPDLGGRFTTMPVGGGAPLTEMPLDDSNPLYENQNYTDVQSNLLRKMQQGAAQPSAGQQAPTQSMTPRQMDWGSFMGNLGGGMGGGGAAPASPQLGNYMSMLRSFF